MFSKRNAIIGWLVVTIGKPLAMRKARQTKVKRRSAAAGAAAAAGVGATVGAVMFWRKRRGEETPGT
jgi:hypothetical protein